MATTNHYAFRYPVSTDPPDGAAQTQALAEDVDTALYTMESTKIPAGPIAKTNVSLAAGATGMAIRHGLWVLRRATGEIEFNIFLTITTSSNDKDICTLPSWAWPTDTKVFQLAVDNTAGAKASFTISTSGVCHLFASGTPSGDAFAGTVAIYTP